MPRREPRLGDRLVGAVGLVVAAAVALFIAVRLIESVLVPLLIIGGVGLVIFVTAALMRFWCRSNRW